MTTRPIRPNPLIPILIPMMLSFPSFRSDCGICSKYIITPVLDLSLYFSDFVPYFFLFVGFCTQFVKKCSISNPNVPYVLDYADVGYALWKRQPAEYGVERQC